MATKAQAWWDRSKGAIFGFLAGAILGALAAGYVHVEGKERLAALDARHQAALADAERLTEEGRASLEAARATEALLRARIAAAAAIDEADRSNFGLAREHLRSIATSLAQVDPVLAGVDPTALTAATQEVEAATNEVAPDYVTFRARLVTVEQAVDALLPRPPQG